MKATESSAGPWCALHYSHHACMASCSSCMSLDSRAAADVAAAVRIAPACLLRASSTCSSACMTFFSLVLYDISLLAWRDRWRWQAKSSITPRWRRRYRRKMSHKVETASHDVHSVCTTCSNMAHRRKCRHHVASDTCAHRALAQQSGAVLHLASCLTMKNNDTARLKLGLH